MKLGLCTGKISIFIWTPLVMRLWYQFDAVILDFIDRILMNLGPIIKLRKHTDCIGAPNMALLKFSVFNMPAI